MRTNLPLRRLIWRGQVHHSPRLTTWLSAGVMTCVLATLLLLGPTPRPSLASPLSATGLDLKVTKYFENGVFAPGQYVKYVILAENVSAYSADDIFVRDTLPPGTTYVTSTQPGFVLIQAGPDEVVWYKSHLTDHEIAFLSVTVRVDDDASVGSSVANVIRITTYDAEGDYDNNEFTLWDTVRPAEPDLAVTKKLYSGTVEADGEITYQIIYHNDGGSVAHDVRITDTLPLGTTYVSDDTSKSWNFTTEVTGSTVVWTSPSVEPFSWCQDCPQTRDGTNELYVTVQISEDWEPDDWLENVVEISTTDVEADYDNNLNRHVWKPESTNYGAAVASVDHETMRLLSDGGFDWMLYYLDWSETEPAKGEYYWRNLDDAIWKAWWYNLKLIVRVDRAPEWARAPGSSESAPPTGPDDLRDFLAAVATGERHYNGQTSYVPKIDGYVIWNEPNLASEWGGQPPSATEYVALLQAGYDGVKGMDPSALVISAGLAPTNGDPGVAVNDLTYLQAMLDEGACAYFDMLGANPMGFASAPDDTSDPNGYYFSRALEWRDILDDYCGEKPIFATEMGWLRDTDIDLDGYNWTKVSLMDQAHYLARAYDKARLEWPWMGPMMIWNMDFAAFYEETEHSHWFSVTDSNLDPLRPYLTLKNAATGGPADLWVAKELMGEATPGEDLVYLITCTNIGGQPATGVTLTDTFPDYATYVSDNRGDGTLVGGSQVSWDLSDMEAGARETITLTLHLDDGALVSAYLVNTVEATAAPGEPYTDDNVSSLTSEVAKTRYYLPMAVGGEPSPLAPDLVVKQVVATPNKVEVTIRNQGTAPVPDNWQSEFWVDLYVDPPRVPRYNDTWRTLGCQGAVWGITWSGSTYSPDDPSSQALPLEPGEEFTLTTHGDYYWWAEEGITWPLTEGATIYAQVDSYNPDTSYGMVRETHEIVGAQYNNTSAAFKVASLAATTTDDLPGDGQRIDMDFGETSLPPRP
jgi:uncharacterized repeat protein (TIGR01451 family)